jgi:UTP-glucose-1-phosphate uridylyltransferase
VGGGGPPNIAILNEQIFKALSEFIVRDIDRYYLIDCIKSIIRRVPFIGKIIKKIYRSVIKNSARKNVA